MKTEYVKPTLTRLNNSEHEYEYITLTYFTIILLKTDILIGCLIKLTNTLVNQQNECMSRDIVSILNKVYI